MAELLTAAPICHAEILNNIPASDISHEFTPVSKRNPDIVRRIIKPPRNKLDAKKRTALLDFFEQNQYPDYTQRVELGLKLGMLENKIQLWFQNRRTRLRRKDVVIEKPKHLPGPVVKPPKAGDGSQQGCPSSAILWYSMPNSSPSAESTSPSNQGSSGSSSPISHSIDNILSTPLGSKKRKYSDNLEEGPLDLSMSSANKRQHLEENCSLLDITGLSFLGAMPFSNGQKPQEMDESLLDISLFQQSEYFNPGHVYPLLTPYKLFSTPYKLY